MLNGGASTKGCTVLEILVVLGVIGVLATMVLPLAELTVQATKRRMARFPIIFAVLCSIAIYAQAQSCHFTGERTIKSYWIENGSGVFVTPNQPFDNPQSCTDPLGRIFISSTNPQYKTYLTNFMLAMSTGATINGYVCGCTAGPWGFTFIAPINMGVTK